MTLVRTASIATGRSGSAWGPRLQWRSTVVGTMEPATALAVTAHSATVRLTALEAATVAVTAAA